MHSDDDDSLLTAREVFERYRVSDRTIDRWLENAKLKFPKPFVIQRRRYWQKFALIEWERTRAASAA